MLGGLTGMLGFDPFAMIQQITTQPQGAVGFMRGGPNVGPSQPPGGNPLFGGFVVPGSPINLQPSQSNVQSNSSSANSSSQQPQNTSQASSSFQPQQAQQAQQHPLFQIFSPPPPPPHSHQHQHHHHHHHNPPPNSLPFNTLQSLGMSLNEMMGPGAMFPGPPLPQI